MSWFWAHRYALERRLLNRHYRAAIRRARYGEGVMLVLRERAFWYALKACGCLDGMVRRLERGL